VRGQGPIYRDLESVCRLYDKGSGEVLKLDDGENFKTDGGKEENDPIDPLSVVSYVLL